MARLARVVVPGCPHHVTQRGNRRQATFFCDGDYRLYRELATEFFPRYAADVWAYCLMPNHLGESDPVLHDPKALAAVGDWRALLRTGADSAPLLRRHERTGRPLGTDGFVKGLEKRLHRPLAPRKAGRKNSAIERNK